MDGGLSGAVRPARPEDVDALLRLEEAAFPGDRLDRRGFRHAVRSPTIIALVADGPDGPQGYVLVETRRNARVARLSSVAVAPDGGGQGTGRRLIEAAERAVRDGGRTAIRLEVRADNARAIALYERRGYRRTGRDDDYYEDGEAALRFEKPLDD